MKWLFLAAGGVLGTFARVVLGQTVAHAFGTRFPFGTLTVNLVGCFAIGLIAALGEGRWPMPYEARLFLVTGFCGAFTTFSAFMLETSELSRHDPFRAALYVGISVAAGFLFFRLGSSLGRFI